jgi:alpha-beta hydrolase superfamily lysophospholipase
MILSKKKYNNYMNKYQEIDYNNAVIWKSEKKNNKVILWLPGLNDYYYHFEFGEKLIKNGYDIWAFFPPNYGKNAQNNDSMYHVNDLKEYFVLIDSIIDDIKVKYSDIILYGHSTGGLVATCYSKYGKNKDKISKIILNSPFFDFYMPKMEIVIRDMTTNNLINIDDIWFGKYILSWITVFFLKIIVYYIALLFKNFNIINQDEKIKNQFKYKIIENYYFDQEYVKMHRINIKFGWIRTMLYYQYKIQNKETKLNIPVLILHSDKSVLDLSKEIGDDILNVEDIKKYGSYISDQVEFVSFDNSLHDVLRSEYKTAIKYLNKTIEWLKK